MGSIQGDAVILQIEDPNASGVFVMLGLQRSCSMSMNTDEADDTTKDSLGWHSGKPTIRNVEMSFEANLNVGSQVGKFIEDMFFDRVQRNIRWLETEFRYDALCSLTSYSKEAPHDGVVKITGTLKGSGSMTRTAL